jgi:2-oxoglutarate dehydrogenase E1 component
MKTQEKTMQDLQQDSYLASGNEDYLENLYESYLNDPQALSGEWRRYFDTLAKNGEAGRADVSHAGIREQFLQLSQAVAKNNVSGMESQHDEQQEAVTELINAYRHLGHLQADIDPLSLLEKEECAALEPNYYGLSAADQNREFSVGCFAALNKQSASLAEIYQSLRRIYCGSIGFEYTHINRVEEVEWIQTRIEKNFAHFKLNTTEKKYILNRLVAADGLEKYLGFKYVGQKRFSLEGGDSLIPLLDTVITQSAKQSVKEIVIGMAHRGRLNVLVNIVGKATRGIFDAFEGLNVSETHSGDVKYHLGYSSDVNTAAGPLHIALAFNPSHLEIVAPVAQGSVRARQRRRQDTAQVQVLPIQIHGDAAFAGQGVVMETFSLSQARWFTVGGSIHIVINNQVGFTTSDPKDARSTRYCTDIAKMVEAPILHVNANDAEAVYFAAQFAIDYRQTFKKDVVIDLVCYRRHGHNEADEPSATQPTMYKVIKSMPAPYQLYAKKLLNEGVIDAALEQSLVDKYRKALDEGRAVVDVNEDKAVYPFSAHWEPFINQSWIDKKTVTAIPLPHLQRIAKQLETLPADFVVQAQVKKMLEAQKKMTAGELPLNWGYAETMAYASLLEEGYPIRLCGQDAGRGTFAHRHAVLRDQNTNAVYIPLSHISAKQAQINIVDSLLSEEAVLAFEYGYAASEPNYLVLWEAQFGDFANGAQVVIDQFISSGEQKWGRLCGLVMLLPHGYEGQGPEHSSARLERYLQLCAQDNMQVCVPSTPAQIFHLLRRQMLRPYRKPLIVMTPKSLLRRAASSLQELTEGQFQLVIADNEVKTPKSIERIVLCSGKVYYDLLEEKQANNLTNIAIVRIEQLYPFPEEAYLAILRLYSSAKEIIWCQEEPQNQGAWTTIQPYLLGNLLKGQALAYAGRLASASPAAGYHSMHEKQQKTLVADALALSNSKQEGKSNGNRS